LEKYKIKKTYLGLKNKTLLWGRLLLCWVSAIGCICESFFVYAAAHTEPLQQQPAGAAFSPYLQNYPPQVYKASSQNWAIIEDKRGVMYFGNNSGILEFDGVDWRLIPTQGVGVRSFCRDSSGKIIVGGVSQMGYLSPDSLGNLRFVSIVDQIPPPYNHFKDVWFIQAARDAVYFVTDSVVYQWKNEKFSFFEVPISRYTSCNLLGGKLFLGLENGSIYELKQGKLSLYYDGKKLNAKITALLPYRNGQLLICTAEKGLFTLQDNLLVPIANKQLNDWLKQSDIWQAIRLPDGKYALATLRSGAVLLSAELELLRVWQKNIGLLNDEITAVFLDRYNDLWLTSYFGISRIEAYSSATYANEAAGLQGSITALLRHEGKLFVGTSLGVFYEHKNRFESVNGLKTEVWALCNVGKALFAATKAGVYQIIQGQAIRLAPGVAYSLFHSLQAPHILWVGFRDGLGILQRQEEEWFYAGRVPGINTEIRNIIQDANGVLWLETYANGIIRLEKNKSYQLLGTENGLASLSGNKIFNYRNQLLVWTELGAHTYDSAAQFFLPDTTFNPEVNDLTLTRTLNFLAPRMGQKGYWANISLVNDVNALSWIGVKGEYTKRFLRKNFIVDAMFAEPEADVVWMGSQTELVRFDNTVEEERRIKDPVIIRNVLAGRSQIIFAGALHDMQGNFSDKQHSVPQIDYVNNTIRFGYALPVYKKHASIEYQYFLEGFDKGWSEFTPETYQTFTNLPEGRYVFRVRARNLYEHLSQEASFSFVILPPWYRSWWAYILWSISVIGFIYGLVRWRLKALERENRLLEAKVAQRTAELQAANQALSEEKKKADALLLNILPFETAEELKATGCAAPRNYQMVSVLFTDFVNFTSTAARMTPTELLNELQACFTAFDDITVERGLEKIKTIGDAYMCAGGIPKANVTNPIDTTLAGLQMQSFMAEYLKNRPQNWTGWYARLGIHTGPLVAGVVGKKKYAYDIWGDTVNIASRIESTGEPNKVNISEVTYSYVKDFFVCVYRGKLPIKNKGEIGMYFVEAIKPELSVNGEGKVPNQRFWQELEIWKAQFRA
jgi:class 3 adenylate cyclase